MLLGEFKGILLCIFAVEAYTASWIEIWMNWTDLFQNWVEAYTASWIEISVVIIEKINRKSRGLYSLVD